MRSVTSATNIYWAFPRCQTLCFATNTAWLLPSWNSSWPSERKRKPWITLHHPQDIGQTPGDKTEWNKYLNTFSLGLFQEAFPHTSLLKCRCGLEEESVQLHLGWALLRTLLLVVSSESTGYWSWAKTRKRKMPRKCPALCGSGSLVEVCPSWGPPEVTLMATKVQEKPQPAATFTWEKAPCSFPCEQEVGHDTVVYKIILKCHNCSLPVSMKGHISI